MANSSKRIFLKKKDTELLLSEHNIDYCFACFTRMHN